MSLAALAPLAVLTSLWAAPEESGTTHEGELTFRLRDSPRNATVSAVVHPTWQPPVVVRTSPDSGGMITEVMISAGDTLGTNTAVLRIDGVEIRYFVVPSPLFEPVCANSRTQVTEVRTILSDARLPVGTASTIEWTDVQSFRRYAEMIGQPQATGVRCFDPSWVLISTRPIGTVGSVEVDTGQLAPAPGTAVLNWNSSLKELSVVGASGIPEIDAALGDAAVAGFAASELVINGEPTGVNVALRHQAWTAPSDARSGLSLPVAAAAAQQES